MRLTNCLNRREVPLIYTSSQTFSELARCSQVTLQGKLAVGAGDILPIRCGSQQGRNPQPWLEAHHTYMALTTLQEPRPVCN